MRVGTAARRAWTKALCGPCAAPRALFRPQCRPSTTLTLAVPHESASPATAAVFDDPLAEQIQGEPVVSPVSKPPTHRGEVLLGKSPEELEKLVVKCEADRYRADQILTYIKKGVKRVDDMSYIPKTLRASLKELGFRTGRSHLHSAYEAGDGTVKFLLQLVDGRVVEAVAIPASRAERPRLTACISSQVGCALKCTFCATGKGGLGRNLDPHEIVDQVLTIQEEMRHPVTHIVFMGMGEPLMNLNRVMSAYDWMHRHLNNSARNVTLSTVGVPNGIRILAERKLQLTLAISLHAPTQELRQQLVPSARNYPLEQLFSDCRWYFRQTKRRVTFEYALLKGVNDSEAQAVELAQTMLRHRCRAHVNLMLWNRVEGIDYERPEWSTAERFREVLEENRIPVTIRKSRGLEKTAACGQLSNANQKRPVENYVPLG